MQLYIWMNCQCSPTLYGWVACTQIPHANYFVQLSTLRWAKISNTLIITIKYQIYIAPISNKCSEALKSIDVILMCTIHNFPSNKARFSHTSTVTRLHSCSRKKIHELFACILFLYKNQCFWTFLRQNIQQKVPVSHSVLLGTCRPNPVASVQIQYYIIIFIWKKNILKCFKSRIISEYTLKLIKLCHFLKIFSKKHAP